MRNQLIKYVNKLGVTGHDAETIVHDVLMKEKAKGVEFAEAKFRVKDYLRRAAILNKRNISLDGDDDTESQTSLYDVIAYSDECDKVNKLREGQRQLINSLTQDADERTTLIVQTFLNQDKPTINSVAEELGLHYSSVQRALKRLSKKFDRTRNELNDFLYAA